MSEKIKPVEKLPSERDIAETLNISRNSVRAVLKLLEFIGLIEIRHGMGVTVSSNIEKNLEAQLELNMLKTTHKKPLNDTMEFGYTFSPFVAELAA